MKQKQTLLSKRQFVIGLAAILIIGIVGAGVVGAFASPPSHQPDTASTTSTTQTTSTGTSDSEPADLGCPPGTGYRRVNESGEEVCWQLPPEPKCPEGQRLVNVQYNTDVDWTEIIPGTGECIPIPLFSDTCPPGEVGEAGYCYNPCENSAGTSFAMGHRCVTPENLTAEEAEQLYQVLREYYCSLLYWCPDWRFHLRKPGRLTRPSGLLVAMTLFHPEARRRLVGA